MSLATLSIDMVARLASLQSGLDKAGRLAEKNAAQIERRYAKAAQIASGIGVALAGSLSIAGITTFVKATIDGVDKLNDLSDATGASIENLSALEDIAARTGTGIDTVGDSVLKLNRVLSDAKPGSAAADALKAIGLNAEELRRIDPAEATRQVAVALAQFADDGNKARLVQELFGKSAKDVAPFLKDLAEAGQLNATVTTEQAKSAEAFNKQLFELQKNVQDAARAVTGEMLPALNKFLKSLGSLKVLGEVGIFTAGSEFLKGNTFRDASDGVVFYTEKLQNLQKQRDIIASSTNPLARRGGLQDIDAEIEKVEKLRGFYQQLYAVAAPDLGQSDPQELARRGRGGALPSVPGGIAGARKAEAVNQALAAASLDPATLAALKAIEDTDISKIQEISAALDVLLARRASGLGGDAATDQAIQNLRDQLAALSPEAQKAAEAKARLDAILEQTPSGVLTDVLSDIELINRAFADGQIDAEKWAEAIRVATGKLPASFQEPLAEISEFAQQAGRNIQDALGDTVLQTLDGKFSDIDDLWKNLIKRMIAQAAAAQLGQYLLGDQFGKTGQIGGAAGDFFKWLSTIGARADGGPITAGRPYLVGERGPEIVVPKSNGTVLPNGVGLSGGGGSTFQVIVQGDASENTIRLIETSLAQFEARMMRRR